MTNLEKSERYVLGTLLAYSNTSEWFDQVKNLSRPEMFQTEAAQQLAAILWEMYNTGAAVDFVTVAAEAMKKGKNKTVTPFYISDLTNSIGSPTNITAHARLIVEEFLKRELTKINQWELQQIMKGCDIFETRDKAKERREKLFTSFVTTKPNHIKTVSVINHLVDIKTGGLPPAIPTGWDDLNHLLGGGWPRKNLIVVGARPGMGKTAAAIFWARKAAGTGHNVALISLEMGDLRLKIRFVSALTGIQPKAIKSGNVDESEIRKIEEAENQLNALNIYLEDKDYSFEEIEDKAKYLKRVADLDFLIVDYLQLITSGKNYQNRDIEIGHYSRQLKQLARKLDIPVMILSQLKRPAQGREAVRPRMSDLRESGNVEQDADIIIFPYRPDYFDKNDEPGKVEFIIEKNRDGEPATIEKRFIKKTMDFADWEDSFIFDDQPAINNNIVLTNRVDPDELPF